MKKFDNFHEALSYQPLCPFCRDTVGTDHQSLFLSGSETTITFRVGADDLTTGYFHNRVISYQNNQDKWNNPKSGNYNIVKPGLSGNGLEMFKVVASCKGSHCSKYGFTLQVHLRLDEGKVIGIYLNSESISIEEEDILHEIKNNYSTEKTEYDRFSRVEIDNNTVKASGWAGRRNGTILFPLMPLDLREPDKLLQRVKNLVIYS